MRERRAKTYVFRFTDVSGKEPPEELQADFFTAKEAEKFGLGECMKRAIRTRTGWHCKWYVPSDFSRSSWPVIILAVAAALTVLAMYFWWHP